MLRLYDLFYEELISVGAVTQTTVNGICHGKQAEVNLTLGLVYRGSMRLHVNLLPR